MDISRRPQSRRNRVKSQSKNGKNVVALETENQIVRKKVRGVKWRNCLEIARNIEERMNFTIDILYPIFDPRIGGS